MSVPVDPSVAASPDRVVLIQLGGELECALTRGWLEAMEAKRVYRVVTRRKHRELLDLGSSPARCHALRPGLLPLLREARDLNTAGVAAAVALDQSRTSRLLATLSGAPLLSAEAAGHDDPVNIEAGLAAAFAPLGVTAPLRSGPLPLTRRTHALARELLGALALDTEHIATLFAPATEENLGNWLAYLRNDTTTMPVVLLPPGRELEVMRHLAGEAFFVRADDLALRAALIARAARLVSDDATSLAIAPLMQIRVDRDDTTRAAPI